MRAVFVPLGFPPKRNAFDVSCERCRDVIPIGNGSQLYCRTDCYVSEITKTSLASARSRAEGVMMVFFPTTILEFARIATRTSSSQTNPTGLASFFSTTGFGGSNSLNDESGGATGADLRLSRGPRRPSH